MPSPITNPARHRAQMVAEAVVSAYIHEIAQPQRPRERGDVHLDRAAAPRPVLSSPPRARPRRRTLGARRQHALELVA